MKKFILLIILVILVAGCGNPTGDVPNITDGETADAKQPEPEPAAEEPAAEEPPVEEPVKEEVNPQDIEKIYHMNGIYDIVPNDPETDNKVVLLTFDDGPKESEMVTHILEVLDRHQAKAIFFVNGYRVKSNPELLTQIHESGQVIGNHSWDHINLKKETNEKIDQQIEDVQNYIEELTGERPQFFRAPYGAANDYVKEKAKKEGMLYMTWSAAAEEWVAKYQNADAIVEHVMEQLRPGSNILLHELSWTVEALDTLLTRIEAEGYSFVDPNAIELNLETPTEVNQP
jgi:peptidoglycan/xylan/chitin deacetylase (PgdA/CDA1 family)